VKLLSREKARNPATILDARDAMCGSLLRRNSAGTDMSGTKGADGST